MKLEDLVQSHICDPDVPLIVHSKAMRKVEPAVSSKVGLNKEKHTCTHACTHAHMNTHTHAHMHT